MSWMMTGGAERPITTVSWSDARLLIVDDQETNIMVLERLLRREGYTHIRGTTKSAEALGLCREFQPDLILLDQLRHLAGEQVAVILKGQLDAEVPGQWGGRPRRPDALLDVLIQRDRSRALGWASQDDMDRWRAHRFGGA